MIVQVACESSQRLSFERTSFKTHAIEQFVGVNPALNNYVVWHTDNMSVRGQTEVAVQNKVEPIQKCRASPRRARPADDSNRNANNMVSVDAPVTTLKNRQTPPERTILQIENNPANSDLVKQIISRRSELTLVTATSGLQGIEMALTLQPDVILLDMKMPFTNGFDTLVLLLDSAETAHIPVVILSSIAFMGEYRRCLDAGAFAYLTKPYKIEDLMASIDAALHSGTAAGGRSARG